MAFVLSSLRVVAVVLFIGTTIISWKGKVVDSFTHDFRTQSSPCRWQSGLKRNPSTCCQMVRNIDMVEALIFYGTSSIFYPIKDNNNNNDNEENQNHDVTRIFLPGVEDLIEECKRDETAVLAILDDEKDTTLPVIREQDDKDVIVFKTETSPPPNPRDLWEAIHSISIQPKGFGGSSGFGRKGADPERSPSPAHCVVLCDTVDRCRAARFAGMRVLCLTDNELADGVMNFAADCADNADPTYYWESINMDDIAMPGSFWLNPPHHRDDEGNGVDILSIIESYGNIEREQQKQQNEQSSSAVVVDEDLSNSDDPEDDDRYLESILMDMDPL